MQPAGSSFEPVSEAGQLAHPLPQDDNETGYGDQPFPNHGGGDGRGRHGREPVFNVPGIVSALALAFIMIHAARTFLVSQQADVALVLTFAFIPAIYGPDASLVPVPMAGWWMPFTYTFLHGSWLHLGMNIVWMLAFGAPVARRFGVMRFILLTLLASAGGALLHYLSHPQAFVPMIGASGAVSGYMGAASRFVFNPALRRMGNGFRHDGPAMSLAESFSNPQFLAFVGVWLIINFIFGAGVAGLPGQTATVAWQAHVGGFIAGIIGFSLLERRSPQASA